MKSDDIFPDISELDRAAGRVSLRKVVHQEGDVSFSLETPSFLDRTPLWVVWLVLLLVGWSAAALAVWGVVWAAGCLRG